MPADPYEWLEDAAGPRTRHWTARQEAEYRQAARQWQARDGFTEQLRALFSGVGQASSPRPAGDRLFFARLEGGAEHPVIAVAERTGAHRVLVDPARIDPTGDTTVEAWQPSWDGELLSYQLASGGTEEASLHVLDVATGAVVDGPIDRIRHSSVAWLPEGKGFYYVRRLDPALIPGEEQYHRRVYLHMLGTSVEDDVLIFGAGRQKTQHYTVDSTPDGRWLVLTAAAGTAPRKDVWIADISMDPGRPAFTTVHEGLDARSRVLLRRATPAGGLCYVLTDLAAGRGRLVSTTPADPSPGTWTDLVAQDPEAVLEDVAILDGASLARPVLLVAWTRHAVAEVTVHDLRDGNRLGTVALPPCGSVHRIRAAAAGGTEAWFVFSSFTAPPLVYRFDAGTGTAEPWPVPGLPAGSATARPAVHTRQLVYPSRDGRPVRMFVISATAEPAGPDRPRPTILTGYGGFGHSLTPGYSPEAIAWVAAGGVYAVANLRGGGEEGEDWHRAGMLDQKQNTFDDFHAAADELVATGWSTADTLAIWGVSNGGLLVGAALTQHPEKYAAAVCVAPLLDMRRYERWGMGPSWVSEYGSAADPEQLRWLMAYSPYHHVRDGHPYPAVLLMAFAGDSRVNPVHARKMCAALQAATSSGQPVLYRLERSVGHGIRSTSSQIGLLADMLAFFADRVAAAAAADPPAIRPGQEVRGAAR